MLQYFDWKVLQKRRHLGDLGVGGRIILKRILRGCGLDSRG
jgi:hypothetical protein